ncbi:uncharacterized protein LOC127640143 isoform X1 [Xyrauchen texanus]|uniref:uncharacterized protein LOC127640143 isoform X1 n=1 Tax=Xyrauchen texanus TaxID=154827 RepID=UPI0022422F84|nr:uncharacterized protein LOC127640143 isoform X1 [Xyrauchen texanus]
MSFTVSLSRQRKTGHTLISPEDVKMFLHTVLRQPARYFFPIWMRFLVWVENSRNVLRLQKNAELKPSLPKLWRSRSCTNRTVRLWERW